MAGTSEAVLGLSELTVKQSFLWLANLAYGAVPPNENDYTLWSSQGLSMAAITTHEFDPDARYVTGATFTVQETSVEVPLEKSEADLADPFTRWVRDEFAGELVAIVPELARHEARVRLAVERVYELFEQLPLPKPEDEWNGLGAPQPFRYTVNGGPVELSLEPASN